MVVSGLWFRVSGLGFRVPGGEGGGGVWSLGFLRVGVYRGCPRD